MKYLIVLATLLFGSLPSADFWEYLNSGPPVTFNNNFDYQSRPVRQQIYPFGLGSSNVQYEERGYLPPAGTERNRNQPPIGILINNNVQNGLLPPVGRSRNGNTQNNFLPRITANIQGAQEGYLAPPVVNYQASVQNQLSYNQGDSFNNNYNNLQTSIPSYYSQQQQQPNQQFSSNVNFPTQYQEQSSSVGNEAQTQEFIQNNSNNGRQEQIGTSSLTDAKTIAGLGIEAKALALNRHYISQSEIGQLHPYQHQQRPIGNPQAFSRQSANCALNGQCEQRNFGPGEVDQLHAIAASAARGKVANASDKCRRIAEDNLAESEHPGYDYSVKPYVVENVALVRPKDRRLYEYKEVELPNDPYN